MTDNLLEKLTHSPPVIFDGAIGTEIYRRNFFVNASFEELCLSNPKVVTEIHQSYLEAGAEILTTNTFNANRRRLARFGIADKTLAINRAGVALARAVAEEGVLVAGSVGPVSAPDSSGDRLERAEILKEQIEGLQEADFVLFESLRTEADLAGALEAMEAYPELPYLLSFAVDNRSDLAGFLKQIRGAVHLPTAIGLNCGGGPESTLGELERLMELKPEFPVVVQPNAGSPRGIDGRMLYMTSAEYFSTYARRYAQLGAAGIGGCCGISPIHIAELVRSVKPLMRAERRVLPAVETAEPLAQPEVPLAERSRLGSRLAAGEFLKMIEITPPRGFDLSKTIEGAKRCREAGIDAVNLPDGPRASARISPLVTAISIQREAGIEAILHCCCRDRSLIGLQAELLGCAGAGVHNILFITGDPPKLGDYPMSTGVFDVDSIGLVRMQKRMNGGFDLGSQPLNAVTRGVIGVGADPSAIDPEREYRRTCEKIEAGAEFIITQPVFAVESLFAFLDRIEHLHIPVIAGIWPLVSLRNAEFMKNEVPGVVVPDSVMERMAAAEGRDGQREAGVAIARESIAAIRGRVRGIQVSAPFGNVELALRVID